MYQESKAYKPNALIPTFSEIIGFTFFALFVLLFFSLERLLHHYGLNITLIELPDSLYTLQESITETILPNFATALVWAMIGLICYLLLWLFVDSVSRIQNMNTVTHRFINPDPEARHTFLFTTVGQLYLRLVACGVIIGWVLFLFKLIPWTTNNFYESLTSLGISQLLLGLLSLLILSLYFFMAAFLCRLVVLRPRVF